MCIWDEARLKVQTFMLLCTSRALMFLHWQKHQYSDMFLTLLGYRAYSREFSIQNGWQFSLQNLKLLINIHVSVFFFHKSTQWAQNCTDHQLKEKKITFIKIWIQFYSKLSALKIRKDEFSQQKLQNYVLRCYKAKIHIHLKASGLFFFCFHSYWINKQYPLRAIQHILILVDRHQHAEVWLIYLEGVQEGTC